VAIAVKHADARSWLIDASTTVQRGVWSFPSATRSALRTSCSDSEFLLAMFLYEDRLLNSPPD